MKKHPDYKFIAINLDDDQDKWLRDLKKYDFGSITELRCSNFEDIKNKWAITRVHRTLIINPNKTIRNGFTNMFEVNFENQLK